ncbi:hypothetical protein LY76DRAFT_389202 [Colletotrichum caudatum]|nr:hypothetical protein LY76DRAFT_389202 [Colletotrichum caudatum]
MLQPVLDIPEDSASPVRFLHLSSRDFLVAPHHRDSNPFWVDESRVHRQTATNRLRVMGDHLREDILNLKKPGNPPCPRWTLRESMLGCHQKPSMPACLYRAHRAEQSNSGSRRRNQIRPVRLVHDQHRTSSTLFIYTRLYTSKKHGTSDFRRGSALLDFPPARARTRLGIGAYRSPRVIAANVLERQATVRATSDMPSFHTTRPL